MPSGIAISGASQSRVIELGEDAALQNLRILNGNTPTDQSGGGIFNHGSLLLADVGVSNNRSSATEGGGIAGAWLHIGNSIVAGNNAPTSPDLAVTTVNPEAQNLLTGNPELAPLADFGGATPTMPPLPGSPAIDAEELANMTDPFDSGSLLKILSFTQAPGFDALVNPVFDITFSSFPELSYSIECDQSLDFASPATRVHPLGTAGNHTGTARIRLLPDRDFIRVRRDP